MSREKKDTYKTHHIFVAISSATRTSKSPMSFSVLALCVWKSRDCYALWNVRGTGIGKKSRDCGSIQYSVPIMGYLRWGRNNMQEIEHARFVQQFAAKWGWCGTTAVRVGGANVIGLRLRPDFHPPDSPLCRICPVASPAASPDYGDERYFKRRPIRSRILFCRNFCHCRISLQEIDGWIGVQTKSTSKVPLVATGISLINVGFL